jgi:ATP-dependent RNA helicase DeaD
MDPNKRWTQALIIAPTRELVTQIKEEIFKLSKYHRVSSLAVYGWSPIYKQIDLIRKWQDIVIWTPWRVIDLIERKVLKLEHINFFVLDEVDRMLDMGFVDDIEYIWDWLTNLKQVFSFSATITNEIKSIIEKYLWINYTFIKSTDAITTEKIDHSFVETPHIHKYDLLNRFIKTHKSEKTIVFVQTKRDTEMLSNKLNDDWFKASYLNWDMRQRERFKALKDFQDGYSNIFVVTDVAARWLNMKNIDLVVNFDVPTDPESYIHRIGRTGRAGAEGKAIMFVSWSEQYSLKNIERTNKIKIKQVNNEWEEIERKVEERSTSWRGGFGWGSRGRGWFGWGSRGWSRGWFGGSRSGSGERKSFWRGDSSSYRKTDDNKSSEHRSTWYFAKRDEQRWQRTTTRRDSWSSSSFRWR